MRLSRRPPPFNPSSSFQPEVEEFVRQTYAEAGSILEYGSGASTLLAASLGRPVVAVESDAAWARRLNAQLATGHPDAPARVVHVDVGRTGQWGKPFGPDGIANYAAYPLAVWDAPNFRHPDVILIDGRLRVACFCTALLRIERPVRVLFDDYGQRERYHQVERLATPVRRVLDMAVFDLTPGPIPKGDLTWMIGSFFQIAYTRR